MTLNIKNIILLVCLLFTSVNIVANQSASCQPKKIDLWTKASFATSGDTVIIQDQKFKLIGVNAPRIERKQNFNTTGQPLAKEAQDMLNKLLANHDMEVGVEYDERRSDTFKRGLVHLYVKKKDIIYNLNQLMLATGYAFVKSEYGNYLHQECYFEAENYARTEKIALWSIHKNQPTLNYPIVLSSKIRLEDDSFRIYKGKIVTVKENSNNYILNMDTVGIRITKQHKDNFDFKQLKALKGKVVEVRGNGFLFNRAMFVKIQSPNAIDALRNF